MRCLVGIFLAIMLMAAIQPTEAESSGGESSDETILSTAYFEGGWVQFVGLTGDAENESESVDSGVEARFYSPMGELNSIVEIEQPCMIQGNMMAENDVYLILSEF